MQRYHPGQYSQERWHDACFSENPFYTAACWIKEAKRAVILTGAGCSVDAGVPDFRSQHGWWRQIDPTMVATVEALQRDYELFHAFYTHRLESLKGVRPHAGHDVISAWERKGLLQLLATQNVDGLHQMAGNQLVEELHGSIRSIRCAKCSKASTVEAFMEQAACECGGRLRPGVVLFGETLPEKAWGRTLHAIQAADLVIVIGTSLQVYPVNQLPGLTMGKKVLINLEKTGFENEFDLYIRGRALKVLPNINQMLDD
nr:NAD-dependent deacylase [Paenibacillus hamazuiensis]